MKFEATTLKDIARALGLSTSTVSRALQGSYQVSEETQKRVLAYAKKINYHPNPVALSLKEGKSRSIGVIVSEIANSFFSQAINGIESIAYDQGYHVIILQTHESREREVLNLQFLSSRSIDGILVSLSTETSDITHLKNLCDKGMPIVFFDRVTKEIRSHRVTVDNQKGAYDATSHLIRNGYRRIANLSNAEYLSITRERLAGYKKALEDNGIAADKRLIKYCSHGGLIPEEVEKAVRQLLRLRHAPDAIFTAGDKLTTNCLRIFSAMGIKVPDDIALAGFSNSDVADLLSPSVTTVRQPAFEMGKQATELLIQLIESKRPVKEFEEWILATELRIQDSSRGKDKKVL